MSDFRVPVPFQSDRVNLLANPKWQKNAKNNNLHIVWADSVLKINRKDGKVIITEGRVPMQVSFLVHSSGWHAVCGGKMKEEGLSNLCLLLPVTLRAPFYGGSERTGDELGRLPLPEHRKHWPIIRDAYKCEEALRTRGWALKRINTVIRWMETKPHSSVQSSALQTELIASHKLTSKALQVNVSSCAFSASSALAWLQGNSNDWF